MSDSKTKLKTLESMDNYCTELRLQIESILVGKPVTGALGDRWKECAKAMDTMVAEVNKLLPDLYSPKKAPAGAEEEYQLFEQRNKDIRDCERAHKIRQAIKICSDTGDVYWMWKLQPGEKMPDNCVKV